MKLIDSLIAGEVASVSPTQFPGQNKSVSLSGKGEEGDIADVKAETKGQKNPKNAREPKDSNGQQGGGLVAMMTAVPAPRTKPTLTLNFGRSAGEDRFVKSFKPAEDEDPIYAPEPPQAGVQVVVRVQSAGAPKALAAPHADTIPAPEILVQAPAGAAIPKLPGVESTPIPPSRPSNGRNPFRTQRQDPTGHQNAEVPKPDPLPAAILTSAQDAANAEVPAPKLASSLGPFGIPAVVTIAAGGPTPTTKGVPVNDRQSTPDRPRPKLELASDSREAPGLLPTLGKVRTGSSALDEPIAFAVRLTEQAEPEETEEPANTMPPAVQRGVKQPNLAQASQPAAPGKADLENVPTNPKPDSQATPSQSSSEPVATKAKPVVAENAAEIVPTNPKTSGALAIPARESQVQGPQPPTKPAAAVEVKSSSPTQETELQAKPTIRSEPAREISIRIPSAGNGNVDVQIVERDGKVQVTVRGSDTQLNSALRGNLTELVHTLDQKGYKTETWTPSDTNPMTSASSPEVKTPGQSESSRDWSGSQPNDGGNGGNPGGNQQQRRQQQERPDWLIELERRLDTEG